MSNSTLRELIKVELTRIRGIAEEANNDCLLYVIDMAISEVETKSHYRNDKSWAMRLTARRHVAAIPLLPTELPPPVGRPA
jgi:hypothetical protein